MSVWIPTPFPKPKKSPLPNWFLKDLTKIHTFRYKDLLIPNVKITHESSGLYDGVGVAFHINGHRIYGEAWVFPNGWQQAVTQIHYEYDFEKKVTRHLNMIQKGTSRLLSLQLKAFIDSYFGVNCVLSIKPKFTLPAPIKSAGISPSANVLQKIIQLGSTKKKKVKKKKFNPSRRASK